MEKLHRASMGEREQSLHGLSKLPTLSKSPCAHQTSAGAGDAKVNTRETV